MSLYDGTLQQIFREINQGLEMLNGPPDHQISLHLTFHWAHLKSKVYKNNPRNLNDLKTNIRIEINLMSPSVLESVMQYTHALLKF